jgi:nitroreductase
MYHRNTAAACMDLGSLPIGGFFDGYLAELMGIDLEEEIIVYGMAVGPASTAASDRIGRRNLSILLGG